MADLQECDMVMKGGITSGVVYPSAVVDLSATYRFRNLGGASAGAIAAAAAAAAEHDRDGGGFERLGGLPDDLAKGLLGYMQPSAALAPVFHALVGNASQGGTAIGFALLRLAARPPVWFWISLLVIEVIGSVALYGAFGIWAALFGLAMTLVTAAIAVFWAVKGLADLGRRTLADIEANNFGFCDGNTPTPGNKPSDLPLTEWLYGLFNDLAAVDIPLTFGDLWGTEATQLYRQAVQDGEHNPPPRKAVTARKVDLLIMGTNLSLARPYKLPMDDRSYLFCDRCLAAYFNAATRDHMKAAGGVDDKGHTCPVHDGEVLHQMPDAPDLPVIVAVRISLSFPLLFSAVPLHRVDFGRKVPQVTICWFADGGIASNFPIHFFDSMWPSRPTFGISLGPRHPDYNTPVYRPKKAGGGIRLRVTEIGGLLAFVRSILDTMQNWTDTMQQSLPGYRDRIVEVRLAADEGGMNMGMTREQIDRLAQYGSLAAAEFDDFDFATHQWIRYRSTTSELAAILGKMAGQWPLPDGVNRFHEDGAEFKAYKPSSKAWLAEDAEATQRLMDTAAQWSDADWPARRSSPPRPTPEIRMTPRM